MVRFIMTLAASAALLSFPTIASVSEALTQMEPPKEAETKVSSAKTETKKNKTKGKLAKINRKSADDYTAALNKQSSTSCAKSTHAEVIPAPKEAAPALAPQVVVENSQGVQDAFRRLSGLSNWLQHNEREGVEGAFTKLNNLDSVSISSEKRTEILDRAADFQKRTEHSGDLMCFTGGKIVVSQDPGLINQDSKVFVDANGVPLLPRLIEAVAKSADHKAVVEYYLPVSVASTTSQGFTKKVHGVVFGKKALLGSIASKTKTRFVCIIPVETK